MRVHPWIYVAAVWALAACLPLVGCEALTTPGPDGVPPIVHIGKGVETIGHTVTAVGFPWGEALALLGTMVATYYSATKRATAQAVAQVAEERGEPKPLSQVDIDVLARVIAREKAALPPVPPPNV